MSVKLYAAAFKETLRTFRWAIVVLLVVVGLLGIGSIFSDKMTREVYSIKSFFVSLKEIGDLHVYRQVVSDYGEYWIDRDGSVNTVYGKRSVKFVAVATVDAVIPLERTSYEVDHVNRKVTFTLPSPSILRPNIDEGLSYVWESSQEFVWEREKPRLYSDIASLAQQRLLNKALRLGITEAARNSAEEFIRGVLEPEGWEVEIRFGAYSNE